DHTFASMFRLLAEVSGVRPRVLPRVGKLGLMLMALLAEGRARLFGRVAFPSFGHVRLNRYFWFCSSKLARRELGFVARPLRASLADAFLWHSDNQNLGLRGLSRWWMRPQPARQRSLTLQITKDSAQQTPCKTVYNSNGVRDPSGTNLR